MGVGTAFMECDQFNGRRADFFSVWSSASELGRVLGLCASPPSRVGSTKWCQTHLTSRYYQTSQLAQTIMSTEGSAIFEKEKSRLLDEITKVSSGRQRRTKGDLTESESESFRVWKK